MSAGAARRLRWQHRAALSLLLFFVVVVLPLLVFMAQGGHQDPAHHVGEDPRSPPVTILSDDGREHAEEQQQLMSRLGSKPPCCDRKCGACAPCKAVQVRAGANYEPIWWKCKCGGAVFDP